MGRLLGVLGKVLWRASVATGNQFHFQSVLNACAAEMLSRRDQGELARELLDGELIVHLDVGARGGEIGVVESHRMLFDVILCEPEREEAERLRRRGFKVIEKGISDAEGTFGFYECHLQAGSSLKRPLGPYMDFYSSNPAYLDLYRTVRESSLECTTVADALRGLNVDNLDLLKIDTQGSELDVLRGLGEYAPLIIVSELQYLPLYHGAPTAYELCQYLYTLGYIPFHLAPIRSRGTCPIEGDGYFMPSWIHPAGKRLIQSREAKYAALMLMYGQRDVLEFVVRKLHLGIEIPLRGLERLASRLKKNTAEGQDLPHVLHHN